MLCLATFVCFANGLRRRWALTPVAAEMLVLRTSSSISSLPSDKFNDKWLTFDCWGNKLFVSIMISDLVWSFCSESEDEISILTSSSSFEPWLPNAASFLFDVFSSCVSSSLSQLVESLRSPNLGTWASVLSSSAAPRDDLRRNSAYIDVLRLSNSGDSCLFECSKKFCSDCSAFK